MSVLCVDESYMTWKGIITMDHDPLDPIAEKEHLNHLELPLRQSWPLTDFVRCCGACDCGN